MNDAQKAADMAAIMRVKASWRGRLLARMMPESVRRAAYVQAWDHLHAAREAKRRLEAR